MSKISELEPNRVFYFFEQLCSIPHGSGNIDQISDYLVDFAKKRNLWHRQDEWKNVIITKEATEGYEDEEAIILQGHMDMVAVKKTDSRLDLEKEGLLLKIEGDELLAEGTSLGGDDGIAVAYALAILDSDSIAHPRLEVVITVDEEVGMEGAIHINLSMLKGKRLINIDSEEEGFLLTSCAGGATAVCRLPVSREVKSGAVYDIHICGLAGGHSGVEIHKDRGNANYLAARVLYQVSRNISISLISLKGGVKDNAIPREASAQILLSPEDAVKFEQRLRELEQALAHELEIKDPGVKIVWERKLETQAEALCDEDTRKVFSFIVNQPNGVQSMSAAIEGLVETSLNLGVMSLEEAQLRVHFSVRSSIKSAKTFLTDKLELLVKMLGGTIELSAEYPAWEYSQNSSLREKMKQVYSDMYGKELVVQAIHAGLECGILSEKIENLDCVSIGPDMRDVHTTEERLSISSTKRVWEYLLEVLKRK